MWTEQPKRSPVWAGLLMLGVSVFKPSLSIDLNAGLVIGPGVFGDRVS